MSGTDGDRRALLTLKEAAEMLRVSTRTIVREALDGRISIVRIRSLRLVAPAELERYVAAQSQVQIPSVKWETDARAAIESAMERALKARQRPELGPGRRKSVLWSVADQKS